MTALVYFIEQTATGLYILIGVGLLLMWRRWLAARREMQATHFELERDFYRFRQANAATVFVLLIEAGLVILGIQQVVAPTLRADAQVSTVALAQVAQQDGDFETATPAPVNFDNAPIDASGVQIGGEELVRVQATPTLTPTPVGTILPNPPPIDGCDKPGATLQIPANGMLVFEPIRIVGTAYTDNFSFYRFEISGPSTQGNYAVIGEYTQPVVEIGELGQFVPSFYIPGEYQFRLAVFDINTAMQAACRVNITISEPIPTATPLAPQ